jgi:hypothetical protein
MLIANPNHLGSGKPGRAEDVSLLINGRGLERWFAKLICGAIATGSIKDVNAVPEHYATLSVEPQPHDCAFLTAPMGSKNCHYEKRVLTIRIRTDSRGRRVSIDDGNTWRTATPSDHAAILISWEKVQE